MKWGLYFKIGKYKNKLCSVSHFTYYFVLYIILILLHLLERLSTSCHLWGHHRKDFIWLSSQLPWQLAKSPWKIYKWSVKLTDWFLNFSKLLCIAFEDIASGDSQQLQFSSRLCTRWKDFDRQNMKHSGQGMNVIFCVRQGMLWLIKIQNETKRELLINMDRETFDGYSNG